MIFSDAHLHTNPVRGLGAREIAKRVRLNNGWFLAIVSLTPQHYNLPLTFEGFQKMVNLIIKESKAAAESGVKTVCLAGIHPGMVDQVLSKYSDIDKAREFLLRCLRYVADKVRGGELIGIGEVGRQHYRVNPVNLLLSDYILDRALEISRDLDCIVHLHLEQGSIITVENILEKVRRMNIKRDNIIIHHADLNVATASISNGLRVTVLGYANMLNRLGGIIHNIMIESDYLDDLNRPGVCMYPWNIPNEIEKLIDAGKISQDDLDKIFIDRISEVYHIEY